MGTNLFLIWQPVLLLLERLMLVAGERKNSTTYSKYMYSFQIELQRRKGLPIPEGWAIDTAGKVTTDANVAMKGSLMPLGGAEHTSGYKGYGLAALVEIFCGISAGRV